MEMRTAVRCFLLVPVPTDAALQQTLRNCSKKQSEPNRAGSRRLRRRLAGRRHRAAAAGGGATGSRARAAGDGSPSWIRPVSTRWSSSPPNPALHRCFKLGIEPRTATANFHRNGEHRRRSITAAWDHAAVQQPPCVFRPGSREYSACCLGEIAEHFSEKSFLLIMQNCSIMC